MIITTAAHKIFPEWQQAECFDVTERQFSSLHLARRADDQGHFHGAGSWTHEGENMITMNFDSTDDLLPT